MIVPNFSAGAGGANGFVCNGLDGNDGIDKFAGPPGLADKIIGGANGFVCNGGDGTNGYVCDGTPGIDKFAGPPGLADKTIGGTKFSELICNGAPRTDASTLDVVNNFIATNAVVDCI